VLFAASTIGRNPETEVSEEDAAFPMADTVESEIRSERDWIEEHNNPTRITLDRITTLAIFGVCGWSLIETPFEIVVSSLSVGLLALAVAKFIVVLTGISAIARVRIARALFAFICGVSVLAIATALPFEYARSLEITMISAVECVLKAACLGALCLSSLQQKPRKADACTLHLRMRQDRPPSDDVNRGA
jgi:hypothetical protein